MLCRSVLELSSRRRISRLITAERFGASAQWCFSKKCFFGLKRLPSIISARKEFSTASQKNASPKPGPTGKPPESKRNILQVVVGVVVVAGAGLFAYQNGHLDQYFCKKKEKLDYLDSFKFSEDKNSVKDDYHVVEPMVTSHSDEEPNTSSHVVEQATQSVETDKDLPQYEDSSKIPVEDQSHLQDKAELTTEDSTIVVKDKDMAKNSNESIASHKQSTSPPVSSKGSAEMEKSESKTSKESDEKVQGTEILSSASVVPKEDEQKTLPQQSIITEEKSEDFINAIDELNNDYLSKDGKVVLDFLQAIHAAEQRQTDLDAHAFAKEKRALKEKFEKELRDSRAR